MSLGPKGLYKILMYRQGSRPLPLLRVKNGTEHGTSSTEKAFINPVHISKAEVA
jgi:hypothetical protein